MSGFKVGDKVRCIDPFNGMTDGSHIMRAKRAYRVSAIRANYVYIVGDTWEWRASRFEKVVSNRKKL